MESKEPTLKKVKTEGTEEIERVATGLRERLEAHNTSRKEVQEKLCTMCEEQRKCIDEHEKKVSNEIEENFAKEVSRLQELLKRAPEGKDTIYKEIDKLEENRKAVQEDNETAHDAMRKKIDENEKGINNELGVKFREEDSRLQAALHNFRAAAISSGKSKIAEALQEAKAVLLVGQRYSLKKAKAKDESNKEEENKDDTSPMSFEALGLVAEKEIVTRWLTLDRPKNFRILKIRAGKVFISFVFLSPKEEKALVENELGEAVTYKALLQKKVGGKENGTEYNLRKEDESGCFSFVPNFLDAEMTYTVKVKAELNDTEIKWSEEIEFTTPEFSECCIWKEHPDDVGEESDYFVNEKNPKDCNKNKWQLLHNRREHSPSTKQNDIMEHKNTELKR